MALQPDCEQTTGYPLRRRCHINPWRGANNSGRATSIKKHRGEGAVVTCVSVTSLMVKFDLLIELAAILQHAKETYL